MSDNPHATSNRARRYDVFLTMARGPFHDGPVLIAPPTHLQTVEARTQEQAARSVKRGISVADLHYGCEVEIRGRGKPARFRLRYRNENPYEPGTLPWCQFDQGGIVVERVE